MLLESYRLPIYVAAIMLVTFSSTYAGRWGADTLANDDASNLLAQVVLNGGIGSVQRAIKAAVDAVTPIDDETASRALAAAELLAAMEGNPANNLPAPCKEWAAIHSQEAKATLVQSAIEAVNRVSTDSETRELMQEGGGKNLREWQTRIGDLQKRLSAR